MSQLATSTSCNTNMSFINPTYECGYCGSVHYEWNCATVVKAILDGKRTPHTEYERVGLFLTETTQAHASNFAPAFDAVLYDEDLREQTGAYDLSEANDLYSGYDWYHDDDFSP
jgi:hypothetical protein